MIPLDLVAPLLPLPFTLPIAVIDGRRQRIPNGLNLALFGGGLAYAALRGDGLGGALTGAVAAYALLYGLRAAYARLRGRPGLGLGDVKFVAAAVSWIGLPALPLLILTASLAALAALLVLRLSGRAIRGDTRLAFGPFLVLGLHATLLVGAIPALPGMN
ncbi:prepilin peptidase [Methylobacterium gossipiicola]|uniref:Leader peptidase (Prepilin peptidase) / N-methyltransferase n=1 Tax=Methylobacterium gossipiicola TaxID=582675 RepID=A0A1I2X268_9HYPH|nr:A24 family peptidase [Methylobacterium gossipiicola]SFH07638.1 leader peptidase (prepilin peptidase) / N-methyltransferase [Methylobacterium gossipiicola]